MALLRVTPSPAPNQGNDAQLQTITASPGVAPWVAARVGIVGNNEGGVTYTGRALRVDARHAFDIGRLWALSLGLGADAIVAQRPGQGIDGTSMYGGGFDVPMLVGLHLPSDLYALWFGPRAGVEFLTGRLALNPSGGPVELGDANGRQVYGGFVLGMRVGFRHVHAAIELDGAYHRIDGVLGGVKSGFGQFTLTPGGALTLTF